jgi:hypothetical protein
MARGLRTAALMNPWLLAPALLLAACGGSSGNVNTGPGGGDGGTPSGDGGYAIDNGGAAQFAVSQAYLTRDGAWCGNPPPFASSDVFELRLYGPRGEDPAPTMDIVAYATAPVGTPQALTLVPWKPAAPPPPGGNDVNTEDAYSPVLGFSLGRGLTPALPDPQPYDHATLTVLSLPAKEGDRLEVRVALHFTDGVVLDQTFVSPPLAEGVTPCGGE